MRAKLPAECNLFFTDPFKSLYLIICFFCVDNSENPFICLKRMYFEFKLLILLC